MASGLSSLSLAKDGFEFKLPEECVTAEAAKYLSRNYPGFLHDSGMIVSSMCSVFLLLLGSTQGVSLCILLWSQGKFLFLLGQFTFQ